MSTNRIMQHILQKVGYSKELPVGSLENDSQIVNNKYNNNDLLEQLFNISESKLRGQKLFLHYDISPNFNKIGIASIFVYKGNKFDINNTSNVFIWDLYILEATMKSIRNFVFSQDNIDEARKIATNNKFIASIFEKDFNTLTTKEKIIFDQIGSIDDIMNIKNNTTAFFQKALNNNTEYTQIINIEDLTQLKEKLDI